MAHDGSAGSDRASDVAVLGAGAAGLTAALFLARRGRSVVVIDDLMGNHMTNAGAVENFPGFPGGIQGPELSALLQQQALAAGAQFFPAAADGIELLGGSRRSFRVSTSSGPREALAVLVCMGSSLRRLGIDGETEFEGRGLSHCATCDGPLFRDREVAVIGGGDAALDEALVLSEYVSTVTLIHRGETLGGQQLLRDRVVAAPNIQVRPRTAVVRLEGNGQVQGLVLRDAASGVESRMPVSGVFAFVGLEPNTTFLGKLAELDRGGHVVTDAWMGTSTPGLFAAGDVRQHSAAQFVSAAGDGATAAIAADRFLRDEGAPNALDTKRVDG